MPLASHQERKGNKSRRPALRRKCRCLGVFFGERNLKLHIKTSSSNACFLAGTGDNDRTLSPVNLCRRICNT